MPASIQHTKAGPCSRKLCSKNRAIKCNCFPFFLYSLLSLRLTCFRLFPVTPDGVAAFHAFLKTEFSEENLEFWLACEEFKKTRSTAKLVSKAHRIFEEFVDVQAPREVCWQRRPSCLSMASGLYFSLREDLSQA